MPLTVEPSTQDPEEDAYEVYHPRQSLRVLWHERPPMSCNDNQKFRAMCLQSYNLSFRVLDARIFPQST